MVTTYNLKIFCISLGKNKILRLLLAFLFLKHYEASEEIIKIQVRYKEENELFIPNIYILDNNLEVVKDNKLVK